MFLLVGSGVLCARTPESVLEQDLQKLSRALRDTGSEVAYNRLSAFAERHSRDWLGLRAALALGYHDQSKGRHEQALAWFARAERDTVLREYASFWAAQSLRALGRNAEVAERLELHRRDFPHSLLAEQVVQALAEAAISVAAPERALAALDAYENSAQRPPLVELRGQALERLGRAEEAAREYLALYYQHALSDEARRANAKIRELRQLLGEKFPAVPPDLQKSRAAALFDARQWQPARTEYSQLAAQLSGAEREHAELRIGIASVNLGASPSVLAAVPLADAELDAERLCELSQQYRKLKQEAELLTAVEQVVSRYPQSRWAEEALFSAGNYLLSNLDRRRATDYYRRVYEQYPTGKNALQAHWRIAWAAYLERQPDAAKLLEEHLRRFPGSPLTENFLYWLGRAAEREGNLPRARAFYAKAVERFPQTYFGLQAAARLREIGTTGSRNASDVLALIPAPAPAPVLDAPMPPVAEEQWKRAQALRGVALDQFAEAELRAAHAATGAPRLLLEAAQAAQDAGRYFPSVAAARQAFPQLEARQMEEVPEEIWQLVYPLPYGASIERFAARAKLDPMLVAGLIRQESAFQREAVSRAGAIGLMQVLPGTGRRLARKLKLGYSRAQLTQPDYNLRLGTAYLVDLIQQFGTVEKALAAYNAGEERVVLWQAEREFEEPAEFVQSIPFSETREYVQVVLRNAELYRRLYGKPR